MKTSREGMVQYFYHSPVSELPIRDVLNLQGMGNKHEPHIEVGAENLLDSCYQRNIARFSQGKRDCLFLITRCANPHLVENYDKQYVVGYIEKQEVGVREDRVFIRGNTKLFSFSDSVDVFDFFGWNFNRPKLIAKPYTDSRQTSALLEIFSGKKNRLQECIRELDLVDPLGLTCHPEICGFTDVCPRYSGYNISRLKLKSSCRKR